MGDGMAKEEAKKRGSSDVSKVKTERANEPTFDVVVERFGAAYFTSGS